MTEKIIIQGGGGHAKVVIDALFDQGKIIDSVFDPKFENGNLMGVPLRGKYKPDYLQEALCIVAIGDNKMRKKVVGETKHSFTSVIHPRAMVSLYAKLGTGCMVLHGSIIQASSKIGDHVIINTAASVDHDCVVGDYVHIAPRAGLCGDAQVGEGTLIGAGAVILPGIKIGSWCVIGAGAVVTKNIGNKCIVFGNPGRIIRHVS